VQRIARAPAAAGVLILAAALLGGCAAPQVSALIERPPESLPPRAELTETPFFAQEQYQCGPASLATALTHAGTATTPEALKSEVYVPAREGSLQSEMLAATRRKGYVAYRIEPKLEALLREVASGTPVIVLQNNSLPIAPLWHYAVAIGYDLPSQEIVLRSGVTERLVLSMSTFERTWARSEYWAMVAVPPQRVPETAEPDSFFGAVLALERVSAAAGRQGYASAIARWPDHLFTRIALGNAEYKAGDLAAAEAAFREATRRYPQAADAWNNLAQTLLELGRRQDALEAAERAVNLGGPRLAQYRATLQAVTTTR
jgi:tetratricopeptide (TPR) repeat protein